MRRIAVIDMGTNTFSLLVVAVNNDLTFRVLHVSKLPVRLGEGALQYGGITPAAYQRGLDAIEFHLQKGKEYGANEFFAFATAATRNAKNGDEFVARIKEKFGIVVRVIEGHEEAELIYHGVKQTVGKNIDPYLVLDIGGGSTEVILSHEQQPVWSNSFTLGVSSLLQQFAPSDPLESVQIKKIEEFFTQKFDLLSQVKKQYQPKVLVGSSGSFDTYRTLLAKKFTEDLSEIPSLSIPLNQYLALHQQLLGSSREQRAQMPGMDPIRIDTIVLASLLTNHIIQYFGIVQLYQSSYALKEGVIWKLLHEKDFSSPLLR